MILSSAYRWFSTIPTLCVIELDVFHADALDFRFRHTVKCYPHNNIQKFFKHKCFYFLLDSYSKERVQMFITQKYNSSYRVSTSIFAVDSTLFRTKSEDGR